MIIPRNKYLQELRSVTHDGTIKIITGVRRCGKSYLLSELFKQPLLENSVNEEHVIQVDLEDRRSKHLKEPNISLDYIDGHITDSDMYYILLGEIQPVPEFEDILNSYLKIRSADVHMIGSNSRMLPSDVKTEFRGRGHEIRVHPLSFSEFLKAGQYTSEPLTLQGYMIYEEMPQAVSFPSRKKRENYLKFLFQGTYIRDIRERYNIRSDDDLGELIDITASNIGCLINPTSLENTFKSVRGHSIPDTTMQSYLETLQDAFMSEEAIRYDIRGEHYINTSLKYYSEDAGLRNVRLSYRQIDGEHLMENVIYNELRIRGYSADIGQVEIRMTDDDGGKMRRLLEMDFICSSGNKRVYMQSALSMPTQERIGQETNSLRHVKDGFPKIVVVGGLTLSRVNADGISATSVIDFPENAEGSLLQI